MKEEWKIRTQLDLDSTGIQKQIIAVKEGLALRRVQVCEVDMLHLCTAPLTSSQSSPQPNVHFTES